MSYTGIQRGCMKGQVTGATFRQTRKIGVAFVAPKPTLMSCGIASIAPRTCEAQRRDRRVHVSAASDMDMGMDPELKKSIDDLITSNSIVVFMKGSRQFPQCGFSNTVVQILNTMGVRYETVDILADPRLRSCMKVYSQWPTFPQVYINGEFYGGCDIMIESYQSGELKEMLEVALNS